MCTSPPQIAYIAETRPSAWREDPRNLAEFPTVCCKLSGMVTEAKWNKWYLRGFHPSFGIVIDAFGTERVMIGSNWPVCMLSGDYPSTIKLFMTMFGACLQKCSRQFSVRAAAAFTELALTKNALPNGLLVVLKGTRYFGQVISGEVCQNDYLLTLRRTKPLSPIAGIVTFT